MSASRRLTLAVLAAVALVGSGPVPPAAQRDVASLATACAGRDGWSDRAPPARIHGNTYYVGTCGITVLLIAGTHGHVLVDGATAEAVPGILDNIRSLGFDPRDVKAIVGSHEHVDHMGGFALLKAATGASVLVRRPAVESVETGRVDRADPQLGAIVGMTPVGVDGFVDDGKDFAVGDGPTLTAIATPGHTQGGTSWTWRSCDGDRCLSFAYVDSLTAVSADGYRFTDHPARVAPFRATFDRVRALPCDVLVTPHPSFSDLFARVDGAKPLVDATACGRLADAMRVRLDKRLADEAARTK